jgi:hypothetical protein
MSSKKALGGRRAIMQFLCIERGDGDLKAI